MKKIIASLFLACLSLAAGAQSSKFDTGTRSTSALGQLEEISGQKVSRPNNDHRIVIPATRAVSAASSARPSSGGNSTLSLALGIITPMLFSALDALEESRSAEPSTVGTYELAPDPVAPDIIDECGADIVGGLPSGCKFERHYPVPGDKANESSVDHDFTVIYWEKEGKDGVPRLKVLRSGLPQNRIHNPLLGNSVNGHYDTGTLTTRYKIERILFFSL